MPKKLTKTQAIVKLTETRTLSTDMLEPLGFSFENFLQLAQLPEEQARKVVEDLITYYSLDQEGQRAMVKEAQRQIASKEG